MAQESPKQLGEVFVDDVVRAFSFLQEECRYGLPVIRQRLNGWSTDFAAVRYESACLFVEVFFACMEAELSVHLGRLPTMHAGDAGQRDIDLDRTLVLVAPDARRSAHLRHPRSADTLWEAVTECASLVREYWRDALCDPQVMEHWLVILQAADEETPLAAMHTAYRQDAEDAWRRKDFSRVVAIYERIADNLSALEQKRLHYAMQHIADAHRSDDTR